MPKFTCSLTTRWVFLLGKPGKAALCSKPGSPASPLKTKSPQPCTNISGGDKERADHTVGARYVRRTAQEHLDQNLSYNPLEVPSNCSTAFLIEPPRRTLWGIWGGTILPYGWKNYLLYLTAQGQPYKPGFPISSRYSSWTRALRRPWRGQEVCTL